MHLWHLNTDGQTHSCTAALTIVLTNLVGRRRIQLTGTAFQEEPATIRSVIIIIANCTLSEQKHILSGCFDCFTILYACTFEASLFLSLDIMVLHWYCIVGTPFITLLHPHHLNASWVAQWLPGWLFYPISSRTTILESIVYKSLLTGITFISIRDKITINWRP